MRSAGEIETQYHQLYKELVTAVNDKGNYSYNDIIALEALKKKMDPKDIYDQATQLMRYPIAGTFLVGLILIIMTIYKQTTDDPDPSEEAKQARRRKRRSGSIMMILGVCVIFAAVFFRLYVLQRLGETRGHMLKYNIVGVLGLIVLATGAIFLLAN